MIRNQADLEQTRQQLRGLEETVAELMKEAGDMHPSQLSLLLEGPMEMVRRLRGELDEHLGIKRAEALLNAQCADASDR